MNDKELAAAKKLFDIPDVKKGSYSFIGDSNICYADIKTLFDYIKELEQENKKYKEVIDKATSYVEQHAITVTDGTVTTNKHELLEILKEVE